MSCFARTSRLRRGLSAGIGIALLASGARAQAPPARAQKPPPVGMEAQVGFRYGPDWIIRAEPLRCVPVRVVLDNNEGSVSGRLEVRDLRGRTTEMPFDLPRKAHKEYSLYLRAPAVDEENSRSTWLEVSAISGSRVLNRQRVTVKLLTGSTLVRVAVEGGNLEFLNRREQFDFGSEEKRIFVAAEAVQDLPRQWAGYEPADLVVMNGGTWREMDDDQRRALRIWVEQGGHAVLCGESTTEWRDPDGQALAGVLPAELTSLSRVDALRAWGGQPYAAQGGGLLTVSGPLNPGSVSLDREGGRPLVVRRSVLRGRVLWLGFDPFRETMRDWPGYQRFWTRVLEVAREPEPERVHAIEGLDDARAAANALPRLPAPPLGAILAFGVVYALIFGPLNIWVLRRMRRTVRSWFFMPGLAVAMTFVVLVTGQTWGSGRTVLNSLSVLQAASTGRTAYEQTLTGIFSPTNRAFALTLDDPAPRVADASVPEAGDAGLTLDWPSQQLDAGVRWDAVALSLFSTRVLGQWHPRDLGGSLRISLDANDAGVVRNETAYALRAAYLYHSPYFYWLGDVAPHVTVPVRAGCWDHALVHRLTPPGSAGKLLENETFRDRVARLWGGARDLLLADGGGKDTWLVAEVADYAGGLQVKEVPYNNRAALLLVRSPRR